MTTIVSPGVVAIPISLPTQPGPGPLAAATAEVKQAAVAAEPSGPVTARKRIVALTVRIENAAEPCFQDAEQ
jgi:hypothetical protein